MPSFTTYYWLHEPQFPHLYNGDIRNTYYQVGSRIKYNMHVKGSECS